MEMQHTVLVASAFQGIVHPIRPGKVTTRTGFMLVALDNTEATSRLAANKPVLICHKDLGSDERQEARRLFKYLRFLADQINAGLAPAYAGYQLAEMALCKRVAFDLQDLG